MLRATIPGGHKIDVLLSQKTIGFSCCWAGRIPSCRSVRPRLCQGRSGGNSCNSRVMLRSQFMVSEAGTIVEHELNRPCSNLVPPIVRDICHGKVGGDLNRHMTFPKRAAGPNDDDGAHIPTYSSCDRESIGSMKNHALPHLESPRSTITERCCGLLWN